MLKLGRYIDPEKLYLATFICQYTLCCCIVWPSFLFVDDCCAKIGQLAIIFWANGLPPPLSKNCPYAYDDERIDKTMFMCSTLCYAKLKDQ